MKMNRISKQEVSQVAPREVLAALRARSVVRQEELADLVQWQRQVAHGTRILFARLAEIEKRIAAGAPVEPGPISFNVASRCVQPPWEWTAGEKERLGLRAALSGRFH